MRKVVGPAALMLAMILAMASVTSCRSSKKTPAQETEERNTEAPATEATETEAPTTEEPKTEETTTAVPATEAPTTEEPPTEEPAAAYDLPDGFKAILYEGVIIFLPENFVGQEYGNGYLYVSDTYPDPSDTVTIGASDGDPGLLTETVLKLMVTSGYERIGVEIRDFSYQKEEIKGGELVRCSYRYEMNGVSLTQNSNFILLGDMMITVAYTEASGTYADAFAFSMDHLLIEDALEEGYRTPEGFKDVAFAGLLVSIPESFQLINEQARSVTFVDRNSVIVFQVDMSWPINAYSERLMKELLEKSVENLSGLPYVDSIEMTEYAHRKGELNGLKYVETNAMVEVNDNPVLYNVFIVQIGEINVFIQMAMNMFDFDRDDYETIRNSIRKDPVER